MYRGVGKPEEMAQRELLRSNVAGLPIGLSALVEADPEPQNDLEKTIVSLNSLNDNTCGDIVQKTGNTVTGVSFFSNRKAVDDDLSHLKWFPDLTSLELGPKMTDRAVENLRFVPKLRRLGLGSSLITDERNAMCRSASMVRSQSPSTG